MASRSHRSSEDGLSIFRFSFLAEVMHDESASLIRPHGIQPSLPYQTCIKLPSCFFKDRVTRISFKVTYTNFPFFNVAVDLLWSGIGVVIKNWSPFDYECRFTSCGRSVTWPIHHVGNPKRCAREVQRILLLILLPWSSGKASTITEYNSKLSFLEMELLHSIRFFHALFSVTSRNIGSCFRILE